MQQKCARCHPQTGDEVYNGTCIRLGSVRRMPFRGSFKVRSQIECSAQCAELSSADNDNFTFNFKTDVKTCEIYSSAPSCFSVVPMCSYFQVSGNNCRLFSCCHVRSTAETIHERERGVETVNRNFSNQSTHGRSKRFVSVK